MQGTLVNLCYTMENHTIATMMTYFGSTDHGLGTEIDRLGTSSKNRLESPLIYIYIYIYICVLLLIPFQHKLTVGAFQMLSRIMEDSTKNQQ